MALEPICSRLERLEQLALVLEQPEVARHLRGRLRDAAQRVEHRAVGFAGIGLPGHRELLGEARACAVTRRSSSRTLRVIAAEQLEERRLRAGGALAAAEAQRLDPVAELLDVEARSPASRAWRACRPW